MKNTFLTSIIIFVIVAIISICIVLNKGHIGNHSLVYKESSQERNLQMELEKYFISSADNEVIGIKLFENGEEIEEEYVLKSSNENIAKIVDNKIEAVSNGKATITAEIDGTKLEKEVRVITPIKSMTFTTTSSTIRVGKELQLKLKTTPSGSSIDSLVYVSSNEEIATVNANGIVTGVSEGKVTITVIDEYTQTEKSVQLIIKK